MDRHDVTRILESSSETEISIDKIVIKSGKLYPQPREMYYGNREYKRHLNLSIPATNAPKFRVSSQHLLEKRCTQMLYRIREGNGRAVYLVGVEDNGQTDMGLTREEFEESLRVMSKILSRLEIRLDKLVIYTWSLEEAQHYIFICRLSKDVPEINCDYPFN